MEHTLESITASIFAGMTSIEIDQACTLLAHMAQNAQSDSRE